MGSGAAAATLGYICLVSGNLDGIDTAAAMQLCREAANRNDSYAQFVVAWSEYELGNYVAFSKWLNRSARLMFPPAICDIGRLQFEGPFRTGGAKEVAIKSFRLAFGAGHLVTAIIFSSLLQRTKVWPAIEAIRYRSTAGGASLYTSRYPVLPVFYSRFYLSHKPQAAPVSSHYVSWFRKPLRMRIV